jgi:hypothetical protein
MMYFKDSDLASESKHDCSFKIKLLTDMMNAAVQQFGIFGKYLSRAEMTIKSYGCSNCLVHLQENTGNRYAGPSGLRVCCTYALLQTLS